MHFSDVKLSRNRLQWSVFRIHLSGFSFKVQFRGFGLRAHFSVCRHSGSRAHLRGLGFRFHFRGSSFTYGGGFFVAGIPAFNFSLGSHFLC